jgi:hypothetical protein
LNSANNNAFESEIEKWTNPQLEFYKEMKEALTEVELHCQVKIKMQTADELIQELWPK